MTKNALLLYSGQRNSFILFSKLRKNALECDAYEIKASLDYGDKVHWSVKNFNSKTSLFEATVGMTNKLKKIKHRVKKMPQVGVFQRPSFLSGGLRLPKTLDLQ